MKKSIVKIAYVAMIFTGVAFTSCSGDDGPSKPTPVEPSTIAVTGVTLNQSTLIKNQGDAGESIKATIAPANATNKNVSWKSSDSSIASVDSEGKITVHKGGTAKITVTTQDGNHKAECTVHVIQDGLTIANNKTVVKMDNSKIPGDGMVVIPAFVTEIGKDAFRDCDKLKTIDLPNSLIEIGRTAFYNSNLTTVTIPNSVTKIERNAFDSCKKLKTVKLSNSLKEIGIASFARTALEEIEIPNSVTKIGDAAFHECKSLTSVKISNSMTEIPNIAFFECSSLSSVTIPNSVTVIGEGAFHTTPSLKSITLPEKLTTIDKYAFKKSGLTSIKLPATLVKIGNTGLYECMDLTQIYCYAVVPPEGGFINSNVVQEIRVPAKSISAYKNSAYWNSKGENTHKFKAL